MTQLVPWDYQDVGARPAPWVRLVITGPRRSYPVDALFDTGAEYSCFSAELVDLLGIPPEHLRPQQLTLADGTSVTGGLAFLDAMLDDHRFLLPIVFNTAFEHDLIGRVGLLDQFEIIHDGQGATTYRWRGSFEAPWAEQDLAAMGPVAGDLG